MQLKQKDYLGDGVYASFDGMHIVLEVERDERTERIYLDSNIYDALIRYHDKIFGPQNEQTA